MPSVIPALQLVDCHANMLSYFNSNLSKNTHISSQGRNPGGLHILSHYCDDVTRGSHIPYRLARHTNKL
jgi:hypothetical protein